MNPDTGYIRKSLSDELQAEVNSIPHELQEEVNLIAERIARLGEVPIPPTEEEVVINMNRQQRRAWARAEQKRQIQESQRAARWPGR